jgi:Phosphatidylinositol 5-phosphate phosphatase
MALFGQEVMTHLDNDNIKQQHPFALSYKNIWADHADYMSMHYAGTGSIISSVTRTGKKDFFGFIDHASKSISRFYIGNFEDQVKQECIDLLVGQHADTIHAFSDVFERKIKEHEKEYTSYDQVTVFTATWNLGGYEPAPDFDLSGLFNFEGNQSPDIIVVGFQEFVELNTTNIIAGDQYKFRQWVEVILFNLKKFDKYIFVKHQNLVGILSIVLVKEHLARRLTRVEADVVKTGLAGTVGNKGGAVIKFYIDDTSFVFINVHLEAGNKANKERLSNLSDIHNRAFQAGVGVGKRKVL